MAAWTPQWRVVSRGQGTLSRAATMQERAAWTTQAQAVQVAKECVFISTNGFAMPFMAAMMGANPQIILAPYVKSIQNPTGGDSGGTLYLPSWYLKRQDGSKYVQASPSNYIMESGNHTQARGAVTRNGPLSGVSITGSYWAEYHIKDVIAKVAQANAAAAVAGTHPIRGMWFDSESTFSVGAALGAGVTNPIIDPSTGAPYTTSDFITMATWMGEVARNQVISTINPERLWTVANGLTSGLEICAHNDMAMWEGVFVNNGWKAAAAGQSVPSFESKVQRLIDAQVIYGCFAEPEEVGAAGWSAAQQTQARRFCAGYNMLANRGLLTFEYGDTQSTAPHLESAKDVNLYGDLATGGTNPPLDLGTPLSSPATIAGLRVAVGSGNGQASAVGLYARLYDSGTVIVNVTGLDGTAGAAINYKASKSYTLVPNPGAGGASYVAGNLISIPPKSAVFLTTSGGTGGVAPSHTQLPELLGSPREGQVVRIRQGQYSGSPAPTIGEQVQQSPDGSTGWADIAGALGPDTFTIPFGSSGTPPTYAADAYGRTVASGLGTPDTGPAYVIEAGAAADYAVGSGSASVSHSAANTSKFASLDLGHTDFDETWELWFPSLAAGGNLQQSMVGSFVDTSNNVRLNAVLFATGGHLTVNPDKVISGTATSLGVSKDFGAYTAATKFKVRLRRVGTNLKGKAWLSSSTEPSAWDWDVTDATLPSASKIAHRSFRGSANTTASPQSRFDNLTATGVTGTGAGLVTDYLRTHEAAANSVGGDTANSAAFGPIVAGLATDPVWDPTRLPTLSGSPAELATIHIDPGSVTSTGGAVSLAYQHESSLDGTPGSFSAIGGATSQDYVPPAGSAGKYLRGKVTATQGGVPVVQYTGVIGPLVATDAPPSVTTSPTLGDGTNPLVGTPITGSLGTWTGSPPPSVSGKIQASHDAGTTWADIPGATDNGDGTITYTPATTDNAALLRVSATGVNRAGQATDTSPATLAVVLPTTFPDLILDVRVNA